MNALKSLITSSNRMFGKTDVLLAPLARFVFLVVLFVYYWKSALTKLGDGPFGIFNPGAGAYVQMFPKQMEAVSYDPSQLGFIYTVIALLGMWAEFILPVLIVIGFATRYAAIGMIGFIVVQTAVDVTGHGGKLGSWFDNPDSLIDERTLWIFVMVVLVAKGGGLLSVDRWIAGRHTG